MSTKCDYDDCGAWATEGSDYCRHHPPSEGVDLDAAEGKAIEALYDVLDEANGPSAKCRAAEALLQHVRQGDG